LGHNRRPLTNTRTDEAGGDPKTLAARLNEFVAEKDALEQRPPSKAADVVALHPNAAKFYAGTVAQIHDALAKGDAAGLEAVALVRELVNEVVAIPTPGREPMKLELVGNLAALLMEPSANRVVKAMVAGARNGQCRTFTTATRWALFRLSA
jgi:hypothetical protein